MSDDYPVDNLALRVAHLEQLSKERTALLMTVVSNIEEFTRSDVLKEIREAFESINSRLDKLETLYAGG